jgi:hypothetical protein
VAKAEDQKIALNVRAEARTLQKERLSVAQLTALPL